MNLLRPIISSLVNKNYYVVILFQCYVLIFASKDFVFLDFKLERMLKKKKKKKKKKLKIFFKAYFIGWINWTYSLARMYFYLMFLPFEYTILCYSSVSSVKKVNFMSKRKTILIQVAWFFFHILCWVGIYFKRLINYQSGITINISNT